MCFSDTKNIESHQPKKQKIDKYDSIYDAKMAIVVVKSVDCFNYNENEGKETR